MPNSLRCRIKKFGYQGKLSDKDVERIIKGLDTSDALENIRAEIESEAESFKPIFKDGGMSPVAHGLYKAIKIIDKHISRKENE